MSDGMCMNCNCNECRCDEEPEPEPTLANQFLSNEERWMKDQNDKVWKSILDGLTSLYFIIF